MVGPGRTLRVSPTCLASATPASARLKSRYRIRSLTSCASTASAPALSRVSHPHHHLPLLLSHQRRHPVAQDKELSAQIWPKTTAPSAIERHPDPPEETGDLLCLTGHLLRHETGPPLCITVYPVHASTVCGQSDAKTADLPGWGVWAGQITGHMCYRIAHKAKSQLFCCIPRHGIYVIYFCCSSTSLCLFRMTRQRKGK